MERFSRSLRIATTVGVAVATGFLIGNMLLVMSSILYRRLFGGLIMGVYELVELTIAVAIAFALCVATLDKEHVTVTVLLNKLPRGGQAILRILLV